MNKGNTSQEENVKRTKKPTAINIGELLVVDGLAEEQGGTAGSKRMTTAQQAKVAALKKGMHNAVTNVRPSCR